MFICCKIETKIELGNENRFSNRIRKKKLNKNKNVLLPPNIGLGAVCQCYKLIAASKKN